LEVLVVDDAGFEEELGGGLSVERADGVATEGGIVGEECLAKIGFLQEAQAIEGPEGVDGGEAGLLKEGAEGCFGVLLLAINEESLGGESPELVVVF
jgi:hypothetical protein